MGSEPCSLPRWAHLCMEPECDRECALPGAPQRCGACRCRLPEVFRLDWWLCRGSFEVLGLRLDQRLDRDLLCGPLCFFCGEFPLDGRGDGVGVHLVGCGCFAQCVRCNAALGPSEK